MLGEIEWLYSRIVGRCLAMAMSETVQTRKSGDAITTSALTPTADIPESGCDVRKVPGADIG